MGSTPSPPPVPDAGAAAATQFQYNLAGGEAAQAASMVGQNNPYGSLNYTQTGTGPSGVPTYTANVNLSPTGQSLFDTTNQTKQAAATGASNLISGANYGAQNPSDVIGNMTSGTTSQMLGKETSYLDPFFTQQSSQLDAQLRNQGLQPGTPAYDTAINNLRQSQGQTVTGFLAQAEPQAYQQAVQNYLMPLTTGSSLYGMGTPTMPNTSFASAPAANIQPPNYEQAVYNSAQVAQKTYEDQMSQNNNMMSGMFGIPTAVLGGWAGSPAGGAALSSMFAMSDRRVKKNIRRIGKLLNGLPVYVFNYIWGGSEVVGVMADDVEKKIPSAVRTIHGLKAVDYAQLAGA